MRELSALGLLAADALKVAPVPFVAWRRSGRLLAANPGFGQLTGYADSDLEAMRWPDDFAAPGMRDGIERAMEGLDRGTGTCECGGEPFYYSFVADAAGRRKESMALREADAQAELLFDLMSHDIDNMHRISIGYLEMALGSARLSPGERELIRTALGPLANASRLIDSVKRVRLRDRPKGF